MESNYSTAILYLELYTLEKFLDMCTRGYVRMFTADCFLIEKQNNKFIKRRMNALWSICTYYTSKKKKKWMPCSHTQQHRWVLETMINENRKNMYNDPFIKSSK